MRQMLAAVALFGVGIAMLVTTARGNCDPVPAFWVCSIAGAFIGQGLGLILQKRARCTICGAVLAPIGIMAYNLVMLWFVHGRLF
jgi:hypothetical protein